MNHGSEVQWLPWPGGLKKQHTDPNDTGHDKLATGEVCECTYRKVSDDDRDDDL